MPETSTYPLPKRIANDPELTAIIRCLSFSLGTATAATAAAALANPKLDWQTFLAKIQRHRLTQQVHQSIKSLPNEVLSKSQYEQLKNLSDHATLKQLAYTAYSKTAISELETQGIEAIVLKGPTLGYLLYGSAEKRLCNDLDILVRESDFHAAEAALAKAGFQYCDPDAQEPGDKFERNKHHTYHLHYTNQKIALELHWKLAGLPFLYPYSNDKLFARKQELEIANNKVWALGFEDQILHQAIHGIAHGWNRLRLIYEIALARKLDPQRFDKLLDDMPNAQSRRCIQIANTLTKRLFNYGTHANTPLIKAYLPLPLRTLARKDDGPDNTSTTLERSFSILLAAKGFRNKLQYLKQLCTWTNLSYNLHLPKQLAFLYPILGPLLWIKRQTMRSLGLQK